MKKPELQKWHRHVYNSTELMASITADISLYNSHAKFSPNYLESQA